MPSRSHPTHDASLDRAAETRARILEAALKEFSAKGLAGARTEQIAIAAGVNKALLYYYFESKEKLYGATLELVADRIRNRSMAVFLRGASPGERILRIALDHFDRVLSQMDFQSLMQQEMMRTIRGEEGGLPLLVKRVFGPLQAMFDAQIREGMSTGELVKADPLQIHLAALGMNVFYFLSAPVWRLSMAPFEPFAPEALAARRTALVEFLAQAIFTDRSHGAELAARVLSDTPMPPADALRSGAFKSLEVKRK